MGVLQVPPPPGCHERLTWRGIWRRLVLFLRAHLCPPEICPSCQEPGLSIFLGHRHHGGVEVTRSCSCGHRTTSWEA